MNQNKVEQMVLAILLVVYILFGTKTPQIIVQIVNSGIGVIILISFCWYLQKYNGSYLGFLGLIASIVLIYRTWTYNYPQPSQQTKDIQFATYNHNPYTLEQEMVKNMLPTSEFYTSQNSIGYSVQPKISNTYNAKLI
jgi:hypothetical protein